MVKSAVESSQESDISADSNSPSSSLWPGWAHILCLQERISHMEVYVLLSECETTVGPLRTAEGSREFF